MSADYNFTVPVELKDLAPEIKEVEVNCAVLAAAVPLAAGSARRSISAGRLSENLRVDLNTSPNDKRVPTQWSCTMNLIAEMAGKETKYIPAGARFNPNLPGKAGEPVVLQVGGALK
jgi:hypothetical protein